MHGTLKIYLGVVIGTRNRLVSVSTTRCHRDEAEQLVEEFKLQNPNLVSAIAAVTWQAQRVWL